MVTRVSHWLLNREHGLQERSDYESVAGYCERDGLLRDEIQTRRSRGHFLSGRDVFVSLPTGSGKSLCYSVLPRLFDRLRHVQTTRSIVVVSPLVALMKEQVCSFDKKTVRAIYEFMNDMTAG